jgi:amino acid transporter
MSIKETPISAQEPGPAVIPAQPAAKHTSVDWKHVAIVSIAGLGPASGSALNLQLIAQFAGVAFPLAMAAAAVAVLAMIYVFYQFAKRISSSGGLYSWSARAWGTSTGFVYGWTFVGAYFVFAASGFSVFGAEFHDFLSSELHVHLP